MCFGEQTEAPSVFTFPFPLASHAMRKWPATESELRVGEIGEFYGIAHIKSLHKAASNGCVCVFDLTGSRMHPPFVIAWSHRAGASAQSFSLSARNCILRLPLSDWFCFGENHGAIKSADPDAHLLNMRVSARQCFHAHLRNTRSRVKAFSAHVRNQVRHKQFPETREKLSLSPSSSLSERMQLIICSTTQAHTNTQHCCAHRRPSFATWCYSFRVADAISRRVYIFSTRTHFY